MLRTFGLHHLLAWAALVVLVACGQSSNESAMEQSPTPANNAAAEATNMEVAAPVEARLFFILPADGDVVSNPVTVSFGIDGMAVVPAGQDVPASGHHHVIIDAGLPNMALPIPADANYLHFGDGSSSTELTLSPGEHTLQLLFANFLHIPHDTPIISEQITITVE